MHCTSIHSSRRRAFRPLLSAAFALLALTALASTVCASGPAPHGRASLLSAFPRTAPAGSPAPSLPANFVYENLSPNLWFYGPSCLAYLPDGRLLVGEKRGDVYMVTHGVKNEVPLWSAEDEVLNSDDCGLMSIAVDPHWFTNHYLYLLYVVDPDSSGVDPEKPGFGRIVRYQMSASDTNHLDLASRTVLLGTDWPHGALVMFGSHTTGSLRFGADGTLFASFGDGGDAGGVDQGGYGPDAFGPGKTDTLEDIGAFRAQYLNSLCGKIVRIDPATGHGLSSNPYWDGDPMSVRSRMWDYGHRNAFRFTVRPGTGVSDPAAGDPGTLFIGDVGWLTWEEVDVSRAGGGNYGWPCWEGMYQTPGYQAATPPRASCSTMGTPTNPGPLTLPVIAWNHTDPALGTPPGFIGNCVIGGVFYTGTSYPEKYRNKLYFSDFGSNWLRMAAFDSLDRLVSVEPFANNFETAADYAIDPLNGDIVVCMIGYGYIYRLHYAGFPNQKPIAVAAAAPDSGRTPLTVQFSSVGSQDPEGSPLACYWNFGDGTSATTTNPLHTFAGGGDYPVVLTVTDTLGASASDTTLVQAFGPNAFPSTPVLDAFNRPNGPVGSPWIGIVSALAVADTALTQNGSPSPFGMWGAQNFGADQEAYFTLRKIANGCKRYCVLLKVQNGATTNGAIEVRYDQSIPNVQVANYTPGVGWKLKGTINGVTYANGNRFGARAFHDGLVQVFKNGIEVGEVPLGTWTFNAAGGQVGIDLAGAQNSRLDDFGGGTLTGADAPPHAAIAAPLPDAFYAAGDTVWLHSGSSDPDDPAQNLTYFWQVDIHHNNHVHPQAFTSTKSDDYFLMTNHDDGTGVFEQITLTVTDPLGKQDTAVVVIHPQVNLVAGPIVTVPDTVRSADPWTVKFTVYNRGGMLAPFSHWILSADGTTLADVDTLLGAHDSVTMVRTIAAGAVPPGVHTLQLVVDAAGTVPETSETDNTSTASLAIVSPSGDLTPPVFVQAPDVAPYGVTALVRWRTNEPATGWVEYGSTPALGDTASSDEPDTLLAVTLTNLAPQTLYWFRVTTADTSGLRTVAPADSFRTSGAPVAVAPAIPLRLELSPGRPNPTRNAVTLELALPRGARVRWAVFDLLGRAVWQAAPGTMTPGRWSLRWPGTADGGRPAPTGVYLVRVDVDGVALRRRVVVLK